MQASQDGALGVLSDGLEAEYRGAIPGAIIRTVVAQTAHELATTDGTPAPMEMIGSTARRRLVGLLTLPRQRPSWKRLVDGEPQ